MCPACHWLRMVWLSPAWSASESDSPVTLAASVSARKNAAGLVAQTPKGWVTSQAGALQGMQLQRAVPISCTNLQRTCRYNSSTTAVTHGPHTHGTGCSACSAVHPNWSWDDIQVAKLAEAVRLDAPVVTASRSGMLLHAQSASCLWPTTRCGC